MITIPRRYLLTGQEIMHRVPDVLARRGLQPVFNEWIITSNAGRIWLFGALDIDKIGRLERYSDRALLHHISTACNGIPVYLSNTSGLRYGFLLNQRPRLPSRVDFPGCTRGIVYLGVGVAGEPIAINWDELGHLLVAGMTRSGKSNFLRLLVHQAQAEGARLLLADLDGATFPMLAGASVLLADIARTPAEVHDLVGRALAECDRRAVLYQSVASFPETLAEYNTVAVKHGNAPLPRILVVLDEFNATATALGGARGRFAGDVAALSWRGLKFGVHVIVAAQEFEKSIVGRVRDQMSAICFRVKSRELARSVGCAGADRIPECFPGRAVSERWGPLQTYYLPKSVLITREAVLLDDRERALVEKALGNNGYLSLADIEAQGWGSKRARRLAEEWERRGWLTKDPTAANKRKITRDLLTLLRQTANPTNLANLLENGQTPGQTYGQTGQTYGQTGQTYGQTGQTYGQTGQTY